ncbi:MAG: hypothetical protein ABI743_09295, partial [bacterium]
MKTPAFTLIASCILALVAGGCQTNRTDKDIIREGTAPPDVSMPSTPVSAHWIPGESTWAESIAPTGAGRVFLAHLRVRNDLSRAICGYMWVQGTPPVDLLVLQTSHLLSFAPVGPSGASMNFVNVARSQDLHEGEIGLVSDGPNWSVFLIPTGTDQHDVKGLSIERAPLELINTHGLSKLPIQHLRDSHERAVADLTEKRLQYPDRLAEIPDTPGANGYLWRSDQLNEARLRTYGAAVWSLIEDYAKCNGELPRDWPAVLQQLGWKDIASHTANAGIQPDEQMSLKVEVDESGEWIKISSKPTIPDTDVLYWHFDFDRQRGIVHTTYVIPPKMQPGV